MAWYYHGNGAKLHQWAYDESGFQRKIAAGRHDRA